VGSRRLRQGPVLSQGIPHGEDRPALIRQIEDGACPRLAVPAEQAQRRFPAAGELEVHPRPVIVVPEGDPRIPLVGKPDDRTVVPFLVQKGKDRLPLFPEFLPPFFAFGEGNPEDRLPALIGKGDAHQLPGLLLLSLHLFSLPSPNPHRLPPIPRRNIPRRIRASGGRHFPPPSFKYRLNIGRLDLGPHYTRT